MPELFTTALPDEDQPVLGNGIKDEIAVDRETAVSNNGDVRYQLRRTEDAPDWETAGSFQEFVGAFNTLSFEFVGLLDGEEYEVRGRTETDDVTGAWTDPVSIVTKFPGFQNFRIDSVGETGVTLAWEDFADNEDGTRVERRVQVDGTFRDWEVINTLAPTAGEGTTVTYADTSVPKDRTVEYRIEPFTPYTSVTSDAVQTQSGGERTGTVPASGWHVEVVHPDTGRIISAAPLDDPQITPSLNSAPRIRVPVRRDPDWLDPALEADPEMRVWLDGDRQPIDELRGVDLREGRVVLDGKGGVELEHRVEREYSAEERPVAAANLITAETSYTADVERGSTTVLEDQQQQDADTTAEFEAISDFASDDTVGVVNDGTEGRQVAYTREGEDTDSEEGSPQGIGGDVYADGVARALGNTGDTMRYELTPDHDIPAGELSIWVRDDDGGAGQGSDGACAFEWRFDGELVSELTSTGAGLTLGWDNLSDGAYDTTEPWDSPALTAGETYTIEVECTDGGDLGDQYAVDVVAPTDGREDSKLTFPDSNDGNGGPLAGPGFYATQDAAFDDAESAFSVVAGRAEATFNDTTGAQRLQVSNNRGQDYSPDDGTENNTSSVDVDFTTVGSSLRARVTLDAYSPQGTRDVTPSENYATQRLESLTTFADIEQEILLINEVYDNDLQSVLNDIATDIEYIWSYRIVDGEPTISWTQPGARIAERDPNIGSATVSKTTTTFERVTVKGSNQSVSGEPFEAQSTFQPLVRDDILSGSESVRDPDTGEQFEEDVDYEIRYTPGEIRAIDTGGLTTGTTYAIDYEYEVEGTADVSDAGVTPSELVRDVPGVTSDRQAEQIAFLLATEFGDARYAADLQIPPGGLDFDAIEAFGLQNLDLPKSAPALEVRGEPEVTPEGLRVRLGSQGRIQAQLAQVAQQLRRVTRRS